MSMHHVAGGQIEAVGIPITLQKVDDIDKFGSPVIGPDGKPKQKCGFRVGGGIDQDNTQSPQGYPDKGVYITHIEDGGPAAIAGLQPHDKLLQVNGMDFTMITHDKACKYIRKSPVLQIIIQRRGMPPQQGLYNTPDKSSQQQMYHGYGSPASNNNYSAVQSSYPERY